MNHVYRLTNVTPIKSNDLMPSPNYDFPIFQAEEESDEEIPDEISHPLEQEGKAIHHLKELIEVINLGFEEDRKDVKIRSQLIPYVKERMIDLLKEYTNVFAWSYQDMPGLDTDIVQHHLSLKSECPPNKQKLRRTRANMALKIKQEVQKQVDPDFLVTYDYPQWLANIVPVLKKYGKVRMCVDYRHLNKAIPQDDFPLPHIDMLVDSTSKLNIFSFMDGFFGYNQIRMTPEDRDKTSFITPWGTLCYRVMSFGLKNVGATYQ